jgi:hypothetical protein
VYKGSSKYRCRLEKEEPWTDPWNRVEPVSVGKAGESIGERETLAKP